MHACLRSLVLILAVSFGAACVGVIEPLPPGEDGASTSGDAGPPASGADAGTPPVGDAGQSGADAGTPPVGDAGPAGADAGTPPVGDAGQSGADGGTPPGDAGTLVTGADAGQAQCPAGELLSSLGRTRLLVGFSGDETAAAAPFDLRYLYLSGGIFDGASACASCATGCTTGGSSCANSGPGCGWWGCWQWDQLAPGDYLRAFVTKAKARNQLPMITYYQLLHASGVAEGPAEVGAINDAAFLRRYFADLRFVLQQLGGEVALLHLEPDFWGYAEQLNEDPHLLPAAITTANPEDCAGLENSLAGFGRCLVAMTRKYAPNTKVGLHASSWGTHFDVLRNTSASFDVAAEARKLGRFLEAAGAAEGDFVGLDALDRDAGYYQSLGQDRWWDPTNTTLPHFHQAFSWSAALAAELGKPLLWWQLPVGNLNLPNTSGRWKDNRVDYLFAHPDEVARSGAFGMAFGAGATGQTTPSTDDGNLVSKVTAYRAGGGQLPCP